MALKVQSPDIPHKSEVGGVALNIPDAAALRAAYDAMLQSVGRHKPAAGIHGVLVQPMAARGVEMIVSSINDPVFGPVIAVGAGGVNTEIYKDLSRRLAPVDATGASEMLAELRSAALLQGWRGSPPADTAALAELVARVSAFAEAQRDTAGEIELNPVLVHPVRLHRRRRAAGRPVARPGVTAPAPGNPASAAPAVRPALAAATPAPPPGRHP